MLASRENRMLDELRMLQDKLNLQESINKQQAQEINRLVMENKGSSGAAINYSLTAALVHEINQPLTAIKAYAKGCLLRAPKDPSLTSFVHALEQISLQTTHASAILQRMNNVSSPESLHLEITDINELVKKTITFLYHPNLSTVNFQFKFEKNLPKIKVDQLKIMQVILNIGHNSMDAFQYAQEANPRIEIRTVLNTSTIEVHVYDNGPGIPKELIEKVQTPHFTTKSNGMGLGLAISQSFIQAHGGELKIGFSENKGTWVYFSLPF